MRVLPSGSTARLVELGGLDEVLAYYSALAEQPPPGVVDILPAARTVMVTIDPSRTELRSLDQALNQVQPKYDARAPGELIEVPVVYDGEDLGDVAELLECDPDEVVRRHTAEEWTVAFCGFAPGFGYMTARDSTWSTPRRSSPRTKVPAGAVALAAEFSAVYPRETPGGWQLIGRTELAVFDIDRDPPALLQPGTRVRFVAEGS